MARGSEKVVLKVVPNKSSDWNKSSDEKKMPELINVVTRIRTNRWEKMLKINKRSAMFIRYWRVLP